jgi:hypothetical protein
VRTRTPFEIQAAVGGGFGPGLFTSALEGAAGGFQIGQSFAQTAQQLDSEEGKQRQLRQNLGIQQRSQASFFDLPGSNQELLGLGQFGVGGTV